MNQLMKLGTQLLLFLMFSSICFSNIDDEDAIVSYLSKSSYAQGKADIIFLLDRSGSVGAANFEIIKGFIESFLTHVVVDANASRVAVISYSDTAEKHIDYLKEPKNKCFLAQELQNVLYKDSGATNIVAAFEEARSVLKNARKEVNKVIVLISDGLATKGGDPVLPAARLKSEGIEIFCFGIGRFMVTELESIASSLQHVYTCKGFNEFKRLARKIRGDPHESSWSSQAMKPKCDHLCDSPYKGQPFDPGCCDPDAKCSCALLSGMHSCVCNPGYYGLSGLAGDCRACPRGTYKSKLEPTSTCQFCPPGSTTAEMASTKLSDCYCEEGYTGDPSKNITCKKISCPPLQKPAKGYILGNCNTIYGSTCHFMCEEGFELEDPFSDVRSCKSNGEWTATTAICREIICNPLHHPKNGLMKCDSQPLTVGKNCTFECLPGYVQDGSKRRECMESKQWTGSETRCIPVECKIPPRLPNGFNSCGIKKKPTLHQTCAYRCNYGFEQKGPLFLQCTEEGELLDLSGRNERPECIDITPPEIICPRPIKVQTVKGQNYTIVNWEVPLPTDNSGYTPKLLVNPPNIKPNQKFYIGITRFEYTAIDLVGLNSSCTVEIRVIDIEPLVVLNCPPKAENSTNDLSAHVYWEEPIFQDNSKMPLKISKSNKPGDKFRQGSQTVTYVALDNSRNSAMCEFEVIVSRTSCPYFPPPINGALTCDDWHTGQICQTYCNNKYDFVFQPAEWYLCDIEAKWLTIPENNPIPWPDCAKPALPGEVKQMVGFYYPGDCNDPRVQNYIKKLFLRNFQAKVKHTDMCHKAGSCSIKTVQVKCGKIVDIPNNRRRRDIWQLAEKEQLQLDFEITINSDTELNDTEAVFQDFLETIRNLNWDIDDDIMDVTTTLSPSGLFRVDGKSDDPKALIVSDEKTTIVCKAGSVLTDELCVSCPPGTFFDSTLQNCEDCPVGYYQEEEGQFTCLKCPAGMSTEGPRTVNETFCKGICVPGTYSSTGLETCMSCPIGTYQDDIGQQFCYTCPNETTTGNVGAMSVEDCKDVCAPGSFSQNVLEFCDSCPLHHYQPFPGQTECIECPPDLSTERIGATNINDCVDINPCLFEDSCRNNGTCNRVGRNVQCSCINGFEGEHCEEDIDECKQSPCSNGGVCVNTYGSFFCVCPDGFTEDLCETEIDECVSSPCQNDGTCLDKVNGYVCVCSIAYEGTNCEIEREICFRDIVCLNGGRCMFGEMDNSSFCVCEPGFSGTDCSHNINECENVVCENNGSCIDDINSFMCSCSVGYTGIFCETDIDECAYNTCGSGSTCQDLVGTYKCLCPPGWNGTYCENEMSSDFILMFPESTATVANMASMTLNSPLSDATISLWIQTNDTERFGTPLSYAVASTSTINKDGIVVDNALTISDCSDIKIYVNNEPVVTDMQITDGEWHHLAFTWSSENSGKWALYKDGQLKYEGKNLRPNDIISGGGSMILGQEQDTIGGGFSPIETFTGNITRVNIWNRYFSEENITKLCNMDDDLPNKVLAWPDFLQGLRGEVEVLRNSKPTMNLFNS